MKYIYLFFAILFLVSCSDSFINHSIEFEKKGACIRQVTAVIISANIAGERYEFEQCMDANFDGKAYEIKQKGDSLMVNFPNKSVEKALFKIKLDIDAKPGYQHLFLDGKEVGVER